MSLASLKIYVCSSLGRKRLSIGGRFIADERKFEYIFDFLLIAKGNSVWKSFFSSFFALLQDTFYQYSATVNDKARVERNSFDWMSSNARWQKKVWWKCKSLFKYFSFSNTHNINLLVYLVMSLNSWWWIEFIYS